MTTIVVFGEVGVTIGNEVERRAAGCTVVMCTAPGCVTEPTAALYAELRAAVRASRYGILVTAGCTLGPLSCTLRAPGPVIMVQPCTVERQPVGCAVLVGPVRDDDDVTAVAGWLRDGRFDPGALPPRLRAVHAAVRSAITN